MSNIEKNIIEPDINSSEPESQFEGGKSPSNSSDE